MRLPLRLISSYKPGLFHRSYATHFQNLLELQEESLQFFPTRPLFGQKDPVTQQFEWTTHQEWDYQITDTSQQLYQSGLKRGDTLALISNNSLNWATIAYACYRNGIIFVPLYETQKISDWEYIIQDCSAKMLLCSQSEIVSSCLHLEQKIPELKEVLSVDKFRDSQYDFMIEYQHQIEPSDVATIIYTSGTTGKPKGVELTHENLVSNVKALRNNFYNFNRIIGDQDCSLAFLPWAHCYGQTCELHSGISLGTRIAIAESVDKLPENLQQVRPNKLFSVPSLFNKIQQNVKQQMESSSLKKSLISKARKYSKINRESPNWLNTQKYKLMDKLVLSKIRDKLGGQLDHCFTGGAAMPLEVLELFEDLGIPIIEGYGLSETTPIISLNEIDYPVRKLGSVGKILDNLEVQLVDQEIWVHGPSVMKGYHNNPKANDEVFEYLNGKKFFKTGDLGSFDDQGRLYITGRKKEQYKLENGKYVVPNVVEGHLGLSLLFKYVIMFGDNQEYNILIVVPNEDLLREQLIEKNIIGECDDVNIFENPDVSIFLEQYVLDICQKHEIKKYEIPKKVLLIPDFITGSEYITPKLSLKKERIFERLQSEIEQVYRLEK